jgi:hypothetical protein
MFLNLQRGLLLIAALFVLPIVVGTPTHIKLCCIPTTACAGGSWATSEDKNIFKKDTNNGKKLLHL